MSPEIYTLAIVIQVLNLGGAVCLFHNAPIEIGGFYLNEIGAELDLFHAYQSSGRSPRQADFLPIQ